VKEFYTPALAIMALTVLALFIFITYIKDMKSKSGKYSSEEERHREYDTAVKQAYEDEKRRRKPKHDAEAPARAAQEETYRMRRDAQKKREAQEKRERDDEFIAKRAQAISLAKLTAEKARKVEADAAEKARKVEAEKARKVDAEKARKVEAAAEELAQRFTALKSNLPFYISKKPPSAELVEHDELAWKKVTKLVEEQDDQQALLYFIKIRSHLDDKEYYKIGITTLGVKERYEKSTQVEVLETVCIFKTELWKAAYLEYHFLREFRLYDGLARSLGEFRPEVRFSGYTEVVRSNSVTMISKFLEQLGVYNKLK
jgi:hypothetical protein